MYNEPQKLLYIESYLKKSKIKNKEIRHRNMRNFFDRIQDIEKHFDKDFSMFDCEEVKTALAVVCRRSVKYQKTVLSELRGYVEWCIDNECSLDFENRLIGITTDDIDMVASYKINMFKDEAELNSALNMVLTPIQEDTSNNILRAMFHLLFNGISYNEIFDIRSNQVDLEKQIIHLSNRNVNISSMCRDRLKYVMGMYEFFSAPKFDANNVEPADEETFGFCSKKASRPGVKKYPIVKNGYAIENSKRDRASMPAIYRPIISNAFAALRQAKGDMITTTTGDIIMSGIFYRIFENEKKSGELDFSEYIIMANLDNKNEYGLSASLRDAESLYMGWKAAFELESKG